MSSAKTAKSSKLSFIVFTQIFFFPSLLSRQTDLMISSIPSHCHWYVSINNKPQVRSEHSCKNMQLWRHYAVWPAADLYMSDRLLLYDLSHQTWMFLQATASVILSFSLWNLIGYNCRCNTSLIFPPSQLLSTNPTARGGSPPSLQTVTWMRAVLRLPSSDCFRNSTLDWKTFFLPITKRAVANCRNELLNCRLSLLWLESWINWCQRFLLCSSLILCCWLHLRTRMISNQCHLAYIVPILLVRLF